MERSKVMKSINYLPIFGNTEPSPPFISFPQKTVAMRDASFSSYLRPPQHQVDDNELSIFDAQKYFNEIGANEDRLSKSLSPAKVISLEPIPRFSSASSSVDGYAQNYRARSFHATPTASSEASWNSQTGLLSNPPGAIAVSIRNPPSKTKGSVTKWFLGRKCPCSGKKSVQVEEKLTVSRSNQGPKYIERRIPSCVEKSGIATDWLERPEMIPNSHQRISAGNNNHLSSTIAHHRMLASSDREFSNDGFSFPVLNQTSSLSSPPIKLTRNPPQEDPPRDSLEVFRPSEDAVPSNTSIIEIHRCQSFIITDDEVGSDASSDLFEIESFSTSQTTASQMYSGHHWSESYCRQSLDKTQSSIVAQTECYEPSETSIEWSVTTAEGFERASVTNFSEADQLCELQDKTSSGGGGKRRGRGGLLSCQCEKAVSVGPKPVKCVGMQRQGGGSTTMEHVSSRPPIPNTNTSHHTARLSIPFAT